MRQRLLPALGIADTDISNLWMVDIILTEILLVKAVECENEVAFCEMRKRNRL